MVELLVCQDILSSWTLFVKCFTHQRTTWRHRSHTVSCIESRCSFIQRKGQLASWLRISWESKSYSSDGFVPFGIASLPHCYRDHFRRCQMGSRSVFGLVSIVTCTSWKSLQFLLSMVVYLLRLVIVWRAADPGNITDKSILLRAFQWGLVVFHYQYCMPTTMGGPPTSDQTALDRQLRWEYLHLCVLPRLKEESFVYHDQYLDCQLPLWSWLAHLFTLLW